ncbi:MAG: DUF547 domain-containing protein [Myxococcales bacterium]|nr:DUF547 domain-containing protein [Myxococcales bacterium]
MWIGGLAVAAVVGVAGGAGVARAAAVKPSEEAVKTAGDKFDFGLWDVLLKKYVDGKGRVDYAKLRAAAEDRKSLEKLYAQATVQKLDDLPTKEGKEAFLINAYNVIVWKNVLDNSPKQVDEGLYKFFRRDYIVAGKETDLDSLEKKWIRPTFGDERVHMALNCASGGCPQLPAEAFTPEKLNAQLDREAKKFCNEDRNVSHDAAAKKVKLSHLFDWYDKDFDKKQIEWINKRRAPDKQIPADAKIVFVDYDWHLNDPSLAR